MSLTGPLSLQGSQAAKGLAVWASSEEIQLEIVDDAGSSALAGDAYWAGWRPGPNCCSIRTEVGWYAVGPTVSRQGAVLWNHGGSADDLARPLVVRWRLPLDLLSEDGGPGPSERAVAACVGPWSGRLPSAVASGAQDRAMELGLTVRQLSVADWSSDWSSTDTAVPVVGTFTDDVSMVEQIRDQFIDDGLIVQAVLH